jgi:hypothetical protein
VLLEFPLDHRTFLGIGHEIGALLHAAPSTPAVAAAIPTATVRARR